MPTGYLGQSMTGRQFLDPKLMETGGGGGFGGVLSGLLANPDIQHLMAGIGSRIDPHGMGAAIGEPTQQMIESQAMAQAAEKQSEQFKMLIEALGDRPGKIKTGEHGEVEIDVKESGLKKEGEKDLKQPSLQTPGRTGYDKEMDQYIQSTVGALPKSQQTSQHSDAARSLFGNIENLNKFFRGL